ncbi:MAG: ATP-binding protein [Nitrospirota bacterium]|nr:ATP-binding protein [Nitrospirota bacterium]MDH5586060.1 ATP-binding protein [Nitrospirota bacterium]
MDTPPTSATAVTRKKGLTKKLVISMLLVGALPLLIGLFLAFYQGTQKIQEVNGTSFKALASETARKLDLVVADEVSHTSLLTTDVNLIRFLEDQRDGLSTLTSANLSEVLAQEQTAWEAGDLDSTKRITQGPIAENLRKHIEGTYIDPGHPIPIITRSTTRALYITDIAGRIVASVDTNPSYLHAEELWWQSAFHKGVGQPFLGPIAFDPQLQTYTFTLALPIMDSLRYEAIGVLRRVYDTKEFFAPSIDTIRFGETGHVMLIDSRGVVLSCPILPTGTSLSDNQLIPLVTPMQAGWTPAPSDGHGGQDTSIIGFAPLTNTNRITEASNGLGWHMFVWQSSEELFAPIQQFFRWTAGFGLLGVGLLVTLGYLAAHRITSPIRQLQEAARRIGRGEFQEPLTISTGDEIEELAEEINRMNKQLASQFAGLESQVQLKTEEVKYLQESTSQILDSVPDPVFMITKNNTIEYLNQASKEILELSGNGSIIGSPLFQILKVDPKTQNKLEGEIHTIQTTSLQLDVPPLSTPAISELRDPLAQSGWDQSVGTRPELRMRHRTYRYRWFTVEAGPGKEAFVGLVLRDTTEESALQDRLIQGEKLASLGVLSSGIGHELNNPLVGVIGLGEAIQDEEDISNMKGYAKDIVQHGKRMASIIRDFTGQMTSQSSEKVPIDIHAPLTRAMNVVQAQFPNSAITMHKEFGSVPLVRANPYEIEQAFTNILTNAFQAIQGTGTIDITTALNEGHIDIRIADSGSGIAPTHLPKVFDPFFTTKSQGEGSGLGLTVAYRIVKKLRGHIRLEDNARQGTVCHITIPIPGEVSIPRKEDE